MSDLFPMRKARLLHIIGQMSRGGAERQLMELCKGLDPALYELSICSLTPEWAMFDHYALPVVARIECYKRAGIDPTFFLRLARIMSKGHFDIVHTWLYTANIWGRIAARLAGIPVVVGSIRATIEWQGCVRTGIDHLLAPLSDVIIVNAQAVYNSDAGAFLMDPVYEVIYNGVDIKRFRPIAANQKLQARSLLGLAGKPFLVGTVGRLHPQKDYYTWLLMARHVQTLLPDAHFVIVGDGELQPALETWIAELSLENSITLLNSRPDIESIMPLFDVFVLSSTYEGLPNVVLEAMACAVPVVATAVDGTAELVRHGETGLLVAPHDFLGLADAVAGIMSDPRQARKMGQEGRARAESEFSLERMVAKTDALYRRLLVKKGIVNEDF